MEGTSRIGGKTVGLESEGREEPEGILDGIDEPDGRKAAFGKSDGVNDGKKDPDGAMLLELGVSEGREADGKEDPDGAPLIKLGVSEGVKDGRVDSPTREGADVGITKICAVTFRSSGGRS